MSDTEQPVTAEDLHAYADGQLSAANAARVEKWLKDHPEDGAKIREWQAQNWEIQGLYAPYRRSLPGDIEWLKGEPLPLQPAWMRRSALVAAGLCLFVTGVAVAYWAEAGGTTAMHALGLFGGNMEGKEVRFGIVASSLFAVITTAASCGAVNAMHDSFTALGGMIPLINMQLGEIIVGGVGAGLYGMLIFVVISIFVAGLMVGRTPEYVGKKIEAREVKMAMLAILILPLMILGWTAVAVVYPPAVASMANAGPHGFSEVLYAFTSQTANNGSAFAGLTGNTFFYNLAGAVAMFVGRFWMIVPAMAVAGSLAAKKTVAVSSGTFPTTGALFVGLLVGVILIVGGLTFFPALALGPIVEHLAMQSGSLF